MRESTVEEHLVAVVTELDGEIRKVQWAGRKYAPDRVVMLPLRGRFGRYATQRTFWVEVKNPDTIKTFPANARERGQHREHERMRALGQLVLVLGTKEQIDEAFE